MLPYINLVSLDKCLYYKYLNRRFIIYNITMMNNTNTNKMETFTILELSSGKHLVKSTSSNAINIKSFKSFQRVDNGFAGDSKDTFDFLKYLWENETFTLEKTENIVTKNKDKLDFTFQYTSVPFGPQDTWQSSRSSQRPSCGSIASPACSTAPTKDRDLHPTKKIFSSMSFTKFGKGYLLTPDNGDSHPDWGKIGTNPDYYHGGWWRKDLDGWFFRGSYIDFLKENGAKDSSTSKSHLTKTKYTKTPISYQEEFDTDYDFKKGKLQNSSSLGHWRGICNIDETFQDRSDTDLSENRYRYESDVDSNSSHQYGVDESDDDDEDENEDISEESEESDESEESEDDFIDDDDDYEFINANDVYYTRYANGLIVVGDFKKCGKSLEEIGGVYNKSLKGYLFKSARVKETLLDMGIQHISFRPQEN